MTLFHMSTKKGIALAVHVYLILCGTSYSPLVSKSVYRLTKQFPFLNSDYSDYGQGGGKKCSVSVYPYTKFKIGCNPQVNDNSTPKPKENYQDLVNNSFRFKWNFLRLIKQFFRIVIQRIKCLFGRRKSYIQRVNNNDSNKVSGSSETQTPEELVSSANSGTVEVLMNHATPGFETESDIVDNIGESNLPDTVTSAEVRKRSESATSGVDLSGRWNLVVDEKFKREYDKYLMMLGQPSLVRSVALSIAGLTKEETIQKDGGKALYIRGINARGVWERTLYASNDTDAVRITPVLTADSETVDAEAWWVGDRHVSWLRGIQKYGGGDFESQRYLDENGDVLVCETVFHPNNANRAKATITWKFCKQQ